VKSVPNASLAAMSYDAMFAISMEKHHLIDCIAKRVARAVFAALCKLMQRGKFAIPDQH
jgi:hypothetical protein